MAKIPKDEGAQEFHLRPGTEPFGAAGWLGVNTEDDPSSIPPNALQRGDDIRLRGKVITNRPGLTEDASLGKAIRSVAGIGGNLPRIWASTIGCFGYAIGTGALLFYIDRAQSVNVQNYAPLFADADAFAPMVSYGTRLYLGFGAALQELIQLPVEPGVDVSAQLISPPIKTIQKFASRFRVNCMASYGGELYLGLEDTTTPGASQIWAWDGTSFRLDISGIRPPLAFGKWRDKLVCGFDSTAGHIRVRNAGSTHPGTWTTYAFAGFQCSFHQNSMQEERDKLYIAGGATNLYVFDGTAVTVARNIATAEAALGYGITSVCLHDGLLHYGWNTTVTLAAHLGRHDPDCVATEWVDDHKALTTDTANFKRVCSMVSVANQIYFGGQKVWVVATAENDPIGALETIKDNGVTSGGFEIRQLIQFP